MSIIECNFRRYKHIIFLFLIILVLFTIGCAEKSNDPQNKSQKLIKERLPVEVNVSVDKAMAEVGDIITCTINVDVISEIASEIVPIIDKRISEIVENIQQQSLTIFEIGSDDPSEIDNRIVWKKWYEIKGYLQGTYIIPSFEVVYSDAMGKEYKATTSPIFIEVKSSVLSDPNQQFGDDIEDILPLEKVKTGFSIYFWIAATIASLLIVILVEFYFKKRRKTAVRIVAPPHEIALKALNQLKNMKYLDREDFREYYFRLSEIFRHYLEMRYKYPAAEMTVEELIPFLEKLTIIRELKDTSRSIIKRADMAKFAKATPSYDIAVKDWDDVSDFVYKTADRPSQDNQENKDNQEN